MKIRSKPITVADPVPGESFHNGCLYIPRKSYNKGNRSLIWYYTCGFLIDLVPGHTQFGVEESSLQRQDYVDVTAGFTLVQNELLEEQAEIIRQLRADIRQLEMRE